jgi:superfamily II DNA or RNA helicase
MLLVDEAHAQRKQTTEFIKNAKGFRVVGLSASPFTKGLGNTYSAVVSAATTRELVDQGWLAPMRVFIAKQIDMTGAKKKMGEWSDTDATERGIRITGDIVAEWVKKTHEIFGMPKKTIVFCAGVAHGEDLAKKFAEAGYNFVSISYKDDDQFKQDAFAEFAKTDSSIHGLIATDILTKGYDQSDCMIGISARPFSKSFSSHVQQMGRIMRQHHGKEFCVWLCHSGNFLRFKDQWEDLYENGVSKLDDGAEKTKPEPSDEEKERAKCPACGAVWVGNQDTCVNCGHARVRHNEVVDVAGELVELTAGGKDKVPGPEKERWFQELLGYAISKGYKDGWAWHKYQQKFKVKPVWEKKPATPTREVIGWIISQSIRAAYAKNR